MVAQSADDRSGLTPALDRQGLECFLAWLRPLQQSLSLEADRGFLDLQGRHERFHAFLSRQLATPPPVTLPKDSLVRLQSLATDFASYPELGDAGRRRLVTGTRQWLHGLRARLEPSAPIAPPRIKVSSSHGTPGRSGSSALTFDLESPLARVRGIGPKLAERLASLGLLVVRDLIQHYPRDYVDYSALRRIEALEAGETATIVATVRRSHGFTSPRNPNLSIIELQLQDPTGRIKVTRFLAGKRFSNPSYLHGQTRQYPVGATVAVSGLVKSGPYGVSFQDPLIEVMESANAPLRSRQIGRLLPVYPLTEGLTADRFRSLVETVLPAVRFWPDPLPPPRRDARGLLSRDQALVAIHRPDTSEQLQQARHRLVFDEFLLLQLSLMQRRAALRQRSAPVLLRGVEREGLVGRFLSLLPFELTGAQKRVLSEIEQDLERPEPMARLVQGDVGSGKTVVAIAALLKAVEAGWQGALMAPTEVLAAQHYRSLCCWLPPLNVNVELLTGSTPRRSRRQILSDLSGGTLRILVGTHALLEDPVAFDRLGLVVVDEQHRFGVRQRNRLLDKGLQPHLLTMTATPIPRTLALSLHGDLDVSQIDELPPGRTPIRTRVVKSSEREEAYELIREQVLQGQRSYVVLPLVEESEKVDLRSAVDVHRQLSEEVFPEFSVGLLHGRLASPEKQAVIADFAGGATQILVSTTVVEVGVDVPEASVMVIDHADRFGLAQLHQLRGRVGRGAAASYCLLVNDSRNPLARQRLEVLVRSNDGFEIAEMDLRFRGPGQVLGTRQSGLPDLALASLADDGSVLEEARDEAASILKEDPDLKSFEHIRVLLEQQRKRAAAAVQLN
ncbi:ATP-dependent DNA helicase RecG [Synechococcus sp. WH 8020]|uniref:ATP-dependent DNA helicase RecG n=1 Tax=unclassified Synechococcus TaxID=2626047 RepID=UPI000652724C|nr:ATP-dependent DNA helicase RecG [Synechococcus sp. WH 8020]AKN60351.1 ATP-dependent DNA helicase RecG [Synechococcus sp. WH 8020]